MRCASAFAVGSMSPSTSFRTIPTTASPSTASTLTAAIGAACAKLDRQFPSVRLPAFQPAAWSLMYASAASAKVGTTRATVAPARRWPPCTSAPLRARLRAFSNAIVRASASVTNSTLPSPIMVRLPAMVTRCENVLRSPRAPSLTTRNSP